MLKANLLVKKVNEKEKKQKKRFQEIITCLLLVMSLSVS